MDLKEKHFNLNINLRLTVVKIKWKIPENQMFHFSCMQLLKTSQNSVKIRLNIVNNVTLIFLEASKGIN